MTLSELEHPLLCIKKAAHLLNHLYVEVLERFSHVNFHNISSYDQSNQTS